MVLLQNVVLVRQSKNDPCEIPYNFVMEEIIKLTGAEEPPKNMYVKIEKQERGKL